MCIVISNKTFLIKKIVGATFLILKIKKWAPTTFC
jgi:hypothetical protein